MGEWSSLANRGLSPFDPEFGSVAGVLAPTPPELPLLKKHFPESYLPIEALRDVELGARLFCGTGIAREFRSSGTTASSRSTSRYSPVGLKAYRWASLYTFRYVLERVLGAAPESIQGYSLIPPVALWPDSSLAQMVAWISEVCPLSYLQPDEVPSLLPQATDAKASTVWLFGTAFHLVDLIDRGLAKPLPPGSVVVETGGTKGKTRSVTRDELYSMVEQALGVPSHKIISEYGMCEMASQAYDFIDPLESVVNSTRFFRFPSWVQLSAITEMENPSQTGRGALMVADPMRVDHPWPLRTEDLVNLEKRNDHQIFQLLGRLDRAPLKGCSLLAEKVPSKDSDGFTPAIGSQDDCCHSQDANRTISVGSNPDDPRLLMRAQVLLQSLHRWKEEVAPLQALASELGSSNAAKAAFHDIYRSLPPDPQALVAAAIRAQGPKIAQTWLLILPRSHSLVGLYPLVLGYVLGLNLRVRIAFGLDHESSFVSQFLRLFQSLPEAQISIVPTSFRLGGKLDLAGVDEVLAYGEDETLGQLAHLAGKVPVRGFGGRIGISVLTGDDYLDQVPLVVRDALTLGQRGCMATRLVLVHDENSRLGIDTLSRPLVEEIRRFWQADVPWQTSVALDAEAFRFKRLGFERPDHSGDLAWPLVVVKKTNWGSGLELGGPEIVAQVPMTLPLILVQGCSLKEFQRSLSNQLENWPSLASCSLAASALSSPIVVNGQSHFLRVLGEANSPRWDGTHEGFPLFAGPVVS